MKKSRKQGLCCINDASTVFLNTFVCFYETKRYLCKLKKQIMLNNVTK